MYNTYVIQKQYKDNGIQLHTSLLHLSITAAGQETLTPLVGLFQQGAGKRSSFDKCELLLVREIC